MINQLLNRKAKSKLFVSKIVENGKSLTNPKKISNAFNTYFCNIAQKLKHESRTHPNQTFNLTVNTAHHVHSEMGFEDYTEVEAKRTISSLNNKSTSDMSIKALKHVGDVVAPLLQHLIASSLTQGIFPNKLKCAKVIPLHKGGSKSELSNYRDCTKSHYSAFFSVHAFHRKGP